MRDLFSDNNSGYRLKTLQIYNWGVFDKKAVTFSFDDKSTILTGLNGSGKTTTVDAILTLLIPPNKRFYNLSSESGKKRERDEKNYTLGAYGVKADEEGEGVGKYLRKKNEVISILNGIFHEETSDRYLSLLQVRYFSSEELKCLKIITEKELRIEDITLILAENNTQIAQNSRWVNVLREKVGSRLFDSFLQYQNFFMDKFGFRSDNALKLFSQTVGLKVLGDITSFIRMYMLEDKSPVEEFEQVNRDFAHVTSLEREIRKIAKEIEFLEKVVKAGDEYSAVSAKKQSILTQLEGLECWFILHALRISGEEIKVKKEELESIDKKIEANSIEEDANDKIIISLQSDDRARIIKDLTSEVERAEKEENIKRQREGEYNRIIADLKKLRVALKVVESRDDYIFNLNSTPEEERAVKADKKILEENRDNLIRETDALERDIKSIKEEIESLEKRENNIPSALIALRERISSSLGIPSGKLPFLGEEIRVRDMDEEWRGAIEALLRDDALLLIVSPEDEKALRAYLSENDLGDKIGFIKREEMIRVNASSDLLEKIEIKEKDNPYSGWIGDYLAMKFPHKFSESSEDYEKNEYAVLKSGLVKTLDTVIKDDRIDPFTKKTPIYLGWSNKERLEELNDNLYTMLDERESFSIKMDILKKNIAERDLALKKLDDLSRFTSYDEIDRPQALKTLNEKKKAKDDFVASNPDMEDLERRLDAAIEKKRRLKAEYGALSEEKGKKSGELHTLEESYSKFEKNRDKANESEKIAAFVALNSTALNYDSLDTIILLYSRLKNTIEEELEKKNKECIELERRTESSMSSFLNPPRNVIESDIDWSGEFSSLVPEVSYYEDFKKLYFRKKDEDMTSLKDDFNLFLEKTLSNVIVKLAEALNSWEREINEAVLILNRNLMRIPFNRELKSHLRLDLKRAGDKDYQTFRRMLTAAIPDKFDLIKSDAEGRKTIYGEIKKFLDKYNSDEKLKHKVLDIRNNYRFIVYEDNTEGNISTYSDTAALSGGEKAKLTYTILASALCYQYNLDNEDEKRKGPFRFVILDEAFSKSDANNSIYALELFKELDLQLMVVTPRNGINLVEGYINSLHLVEKNEVTNTSSVSSMTIEEYKNS